MLHTHLQTDRLIL